LLKARLLEMDARFLIIDPLAAFLVGHDANKDQEVRQALYALYLVARECRTATVLMRHLNKRSGGSAMYWGNMSIAMIGHSRAGLLVARDPDDDRHRILAMVKCNYAAEPPALRYHLEP
jgi:RecA-family ATPase